MLQIQLPGLLVVTDICEEKDPPLIEAIPFPSIIWLSIQRDCLDQLLTVCA